MARGILTNESHWGLHIFVETPSGAREEIVRKTAWQCGQKLSQRVYIWLISPWLEGPECCRGCVGDWAVLTIFRKRRFLGLGWHVCVCVCVFPLPDGPRVEGLGNSGSNLVSWLASLGQASSYVLTPAAATPEKPK